MTAPLTPLPHLPTLSGNVFYQYMADAARWVVKVYRGRHARRRWACERNLLAHWRRHALPVPDVRDEELPDTPQPYLILRYLPGTSLRSLLLDANLPSDRKWAAVETALACTCDRARLALACRDIRLIHSDPNSGNLIFHQGGLSWIDLEAEKRASSVPDAAAEEITKLARWIARDLGPCATPEVCRRVVAAYQGLEAVLERAIGRTCGRSWQLVHRFRDQWRKARRPGEVTKYDIADGLRQALAARFAPRHAG